MTASFAGEKKDFFSRLHLPDSLFGQLLLIFGLGVVILQIANFLVVCGVQALYVQNAEKVRAEQFVSYWSLLNAMPKYQRMPTIKRMTKLYAGNASKMKLSILLEPPRWDEPAPEAQRQLTIINDIFVETGGIRPTVYIQSNVSEGIMPDIIPIHLPSLLLAAELSDGTWLQMDTPYYVDDRPMVWSQRLFVLFEAIVIILATACLLRRATKPIHRLSEAAEAFGRSPETAEPFPDTGVREIRIVAHSFNRMRRQIQGSFAERNRMIAAMAHDLRTPLTKLQLRLERVEPEALREKLVDTVSGMNSIISQGLDFARSLSTEEAMMKTDLASFLQSIAEDYEDVGKKVFFTASESDEPLIVRARPLSLRRTVENLISNACAYAGSAHISVEASPTSCTVVIRDDGPGIPEEALEHVFEPYYRLESSRNRSSGGTGLGLAIARNMALLNNAELTLRNRPEGGLEARLTIPKA